jgi:hypothetical protein
MSRIRGKDTLYAKIMSLFILGFLPFPNEPLTES